MSPDKAFILAAGFGSRMRPLTDHVPKPMVEVDGVSLLDRSLNQLSEAGVSNVVINTHHLASKIEEHVQGRSSPKIHLSHEEDILETGGGIKKALSVFEDEAFFALNGDGLWEDTPGNSPYKELSGAWDPEKMDILMLLQPTQSMALTKGVGDYDLDDEGRALRSLNQSGAYMFTSLRINHPRIFKDTPDGAFSYLELMDRAQKEGRLFGLVNTGQWHHISTPEDLARVNDAYTQRKKTG